MFGSAAARITDPAFRAAIDWLRTFIPIEQLAAFMCGSLAARITNPEFRAAVDRLRVGLGLPRMQSIMCTGVASRLLIPGYLDLVLALAARLDAWGAGHRLRRFLNSSPFVGDVAALVIRFDAMDKTTGLKTIAHLLRGGTYASRKRTRDEFIKL